LLRFWLKMAMARMFLLPRRKKDFLPDFSGVNGAR